MKTKMRFVRHALCACVAAVGLQGFAVPRVTVDGVAQQWPWNNGVDITYTVHNGQDVAAGRYYRIAFTVTIAGQTYTVSGDALGASTVDGQHTVTWYNPPAGVKPTTLALTAALYTADVPSGDDYMIVDLTSGAITYEGLYATQDASNARYAQTVYKTDKMVLRKVAGGGTYPTGDNTNYADANAERTWTTDRDYWIGIYQVTCTQYNRLGMNQSWSFSKDYETNLAATRAAHGISWNMLRGENTPSTSALEPDADGTFLQRLNARTCAASGVQGFDLPTEVMYEIAQRAGAKTVYAWGSSINTNYFVSIETMTNATEKTERVMSVGTRLPNAWGLFDTAGNVWEWCLDDTSLKNMANAADPFTPAYVAGTNKRLMRGGGGFNSKALAGDNFQFRASWRGSQTPENNHANRGFRIAIIRPFRP